MFEECSDTNQLKDIKDIGKYVAHSELNLIIFVVFLLSQATWMFDVLSHTSDLYQGSAPVDR